MDESMNTYDSDAPERGGRRQPWVVVLVLFAVGCLGVPLIATCVITILALLGPAVGEVFSSIVNGI